MPLSPAQLAANFADIHPPLGDDAALVEASRCYFCHDAPCVEACPTEIDVPGFIRRIASGNLRGAAVTILEQNIFGGSCARVCPTEILCERACVRTAQEARPVNIGGLQRHATDWLMQRGIQPFERAAATGRRVAVVGAGPAGLACAHALARFGHEVVVYEARPKAGGLTEYGIAAYKVPDDFAQREAAFVLGIGGISIVPGVLGGTSRWASCVRTTMRGVLGIGQRGVNALRLDGETLAGVRDAVDFIAELRQATGLAALTVGRRVVVIGGGNTAIDAAVQAKRLWRCHSDAGLSSWSRADVGHAGGAGLGADERRAHPPLGHAGGFRRVRRHGEAEWCSRTLMPAGSGSRWIATWC